MNNEIEQKGFGICLAGCAAGCAAACASDAILPIGDVAGGAAAASAAGAGSK